jgi:hypothetical protein
MISFMISVVPPKIDWTRLSRHSPQPCRLRSAAQAEVVTRAAVKPQVTTSRTGASSDIA